MRVTLMGQHAQEAPRLRALLPASIAVAALDQFPPQGLLHTEVLVTTRLSADEAARLRCDLLQAPSTGVDGIALDALAPSCKVCNVHGHEGPVAEFVIHAILGHFLQDAAGSWHLDGRGWPQAYAGRRRHGEAAGATVGLLGFGRIGREVARRARALDMKVVAITRGATDGLADKAFGPGDLNLALAELDVLVLCCPLTEQTRGCMAAPQFSAMKRSALLVNVARAEVAQEQALFDALQRRDIAGAVLDVWYAYPAPGVESLAPSRLPFHELANARCTPHLAGWSQALATRRYLDIAKNIELLRADKPLNNQLR